LSHRFGVLASRVDERFGKVTGSLQLPVTWRTSIHKDGSTPGEPGVRKSVEYDTFSLKWSNSYCVGWTISKIQSKKVVCYIVGGDDLTRDLHVLQLQLPPPPPSSLAPIKCIMVAFCYRLIWMIMSWKMAVKQVMLVCWWW